MLLPEALSARRSLAQVGANRDPITGRLWGDAFFEQVELRRERQPDRRHIVVSVHADSMGYFANMYGRLVADEIAIAICERVEWALGAEGGQLLARLDNAWFVGIVTLPPNAETEVRLERLRISLADTLAEPMDSSVGRLHLRAAIGLAALGGENPSAGSTVRLCRLAADELAEPADIRAVVVDGLLREAALRRQRLASDLSMAIDNDALTLLFQPKIEAESQQVAGLECLLRWQHNTLGLILPTEIVEIASEVGLMTRLDRWVLSQAIGRVRDWRQRGYRFGRLSINITTQTLIDPNFTGWLHAELRDADVAAEHFDLEIVESSVASDFDAVVQVMHKLSGDGITFSLDDFGTGFSSLAILRELPVSTLKIDKSFIDSVVDDARSASLCSGIVNLAHELGLNTVAEGVETASQSGVLRALRCDQLQGFCFDEPLTATDFERRYGGEVLADADT
jgi:EAL domain-containing protein (putative c-di-GMP-specific phosphodiesterase class I)/GGDEF domain-containing protein